MADYLVDTDVLIQAIRLKQGRRELLRDLVANGSSLGCSVVTVAELYAGMRDHEKQRSEAFVAEFDLFDVNLEIARLAGSLRNRWAGQGHSLALPDMFTAATA